MSRTKQHLSRPELPNLDEIMKDLASAPNDDVAFTFLQNLQSENEVFQRSKQVKVESRISGESSSSVSVDTTKSFESAAKRPRQETSKTSSKQRAEEQPGQIKEEHRNQECYVKVLRFLEMNSYLRDSQERMTQQCTDLQELGQTVKDQIESLKTQLHTS